MSVLRIGVDVGGTNTDGVLLDPLTTSQANRGILAWHKSPTTSNPSQGIENVITTLLQAAKVDAGAVASVTIGTTHRKRPESTGARSCNPAVWSIFAETFPQGSTGQRICGTSYAAIAAASTVDLKSNGQLISNVDEAQIAAECQIIKDKNIRAIVVNGIFSPSDIVERQEERVAEWVRNYYPEADVVISKEVANLGFIERENAAILNASILPFAKTTIRSFEHAISRLKLTAPCSSRKTMARSSCTSRRPAAHPDVLQWANELRVRRRVFGTKEAEKESMLVVDIGGTTTDVGMLLGSGLPRQGRRGDRDLGRTDEFLVPRRPRGPSRPKADGWHGLRGPPYPDARTGVRRERGHCDGLCGRRAGPAHIGDASLVPASARDDVPEYTVVVTQMLERIIDSMKTADYDIPVLLVGGGAVIAPDTLKGASRVVKPEYSGVANAIGAGKGAFAGQKRMLTERDSDCQSVWDDRHDGEHRRPDDARCLGGYPKKWRSIKRSRMAPFGSRFKIAEMDAIPLQYVANKSRVIVKAIGDFDFSIVTPKSDLPETRDDVVEHDVAEKKPPTVNANREWIISEVDLEWISTGCYILGTAEAAPYPHFVRLREMMRKGAVVRVISPDDLKDSAVVACGGGKGSPTVGIEKLPANEQMEAQRLVYKELGYQPDAVLALEIGGGNGLQGMLLGASNNLNVPTVDGDWMGRAYPVSWQITPVVLGGDKAHFIPTAIADGNGNNIILLSGSSEKLIERIFRAALSEMGSHVACAKGPCTGKNTKA
ncbi:hypothetical protein FB451DRAFT_1161203, partial [Mycena latifolia]